MKLIVLLSNKLMENVCSVLNPNLLSIFILTNKLSAFLAHSKYPNKL